ncbi:5-keto-4-deoxy-D-glucarate aldolase [Trichoderma lentiforme]|uniref:5-keto-4-deoxy-D-glucarate aldolase n=1 Tax=Trichoderma lentiforme TaxID=1567552 RepID=A0A9P4XCG9_9HYPO|nr:5-keto-4-deoxy-D-glucarate aldolase [Trichoderma lentiforme]
MAAVMANAFLKQTAAGRLCKAFGIRLVTNPQIVQLARNAGFDCIFIDLEHSTLSIDDSSRLCIAGLNSGITPFVRVPHQCGNGFVQRVQDGGAMGIIFPHIHDKGRDAQAAVSITKYPPQGKRSMTGQLPLFSLQPTPIPVVVKETNSAGSTVILMIETVESIKNIDEIAGTEGVDLLLIGANDLSIELGVPGQFDSQVFRGALETVSGACKRHKKVMGLAGIYDNSVFQQWAVDVLGVRFILGQQDSGILARHAKGCLETLQALDPK